MNPSSNHMHAKLMISLMFSRCTLMMLLVVLIIHCSAFLSCHVVVRIISSTEIGIGIYRLSVIFVPMNYSAALPQLSWCRPGFCVSASIFFSYNQNSAHWQWPAGFVYMQTSEVEEGLQTFVNRFGSSICIQLFVGTGMYLTPFNEFTTCQTTITFNSI